MVATTCSDHPPTGAVELREDVPLAGAAAGAGGARRCAGPRLIAAAFAALSAAITLALLTQIYYGDYEVVPHGSVSSSVAACSEGGARLLRAGGGALDAAVAAALCLAAARPGPAALNASGSVLYWEYRTAHGADPTLAEWDAAGIEAAGEETGPPQLLGALVALHARFGVLPWALVLQPAIDLAELAAAGGEAGGNAESSAAARALSAQLRAVQHNTSTEVCAAWRCAALVRVSAAQRVASGAWRAYAGGAAAGAGPAREALRRALAGDAAPEPPARPAQGSALAVVDTRGTYVALATGAGEAGALPDYAPAIIVDEHICGTRYVVGAASRGALLQTAAALVRGAAPADAVEAARADPAPVNLVRQRGDALLSHADSRAGGLAARF
ncbi:glutathione hydrolase 6-like [Battus philenor]|uniref:glutathione hydrolase 6-like n=1 Tax=Battus philenor TaxID=42288 RepID=UPI0035CFE94A